MEKNDEKNRLPLARRLNRPAADVELAAIAVGLDVRLRAADMPGSMQERAFRHARALVDAAPNHQLNPTRIALALKKDFDSCYGPAWHCIVGKSFGSFVTHSPAGFLYFSLDKLSILLFKTEVQPVMESIPQRSLPCLPGQER